MSISDQERTEISSYWNVCWQKVWNKSREPREVRGIPENFTLDSYSFTPPPVYTSSEIRSRK